MYMQSGWSCDSLVSLQHGDLTVTVGNTTDLGVTIEDTGDTDPGTGGGIRPRGRS